MVEENKIQFNTVLRKAGGSVILTVPEKIIEEGNFIVGQRVKISITDKELIIKEFECQLCKARRSIEEGDDIYCTACGSEQMEEVNE